MQKLKDAILIFSSDYSFIALICAFTGLLFFDNLSPNVARLVVMFSAIVMLSALDAIIFNKILVSHNAGHNDETNQQLTTYRMLQGTIQIFVFVSVFIISGTLSALLCIILWWLGVCDLLFYILLLQTNYMFAERNMTWLWWTIPGLITRIFGGQFGGKALTLTSIAGIIITTWILL